MIQSKIKTIHQFTPTVSYGDGVSSGLLYTQKILHQMGFYSYIYIASTSVDIRFKKEVFHITEYKESKDQILLYHHSIGHNCHEHIMAFADHKILVYHNITPSHFFKKKSFLYQLCEQGREQLKASVNHFIGSYADSFYNTQELIHYGYKNPQVIPVLFDIQDKLPSNQETICPRDDVYTILYVGRIVQNKAQHQLIEIVYFLKQHYNIHVRLHLVGSASQPHYLAYLQEYSKLLEVSKQVVFIKDASDQELHFYYEQADIYLSLSEHEGFGIPLVEAMLHDTLVLAYDVGSVGSIVQKEGLLQKKSVDFVVKKIVDLMQNSQKRANLIRAQRAFLSTLAHEQIYQKLQFFLISYGLSPKKLQKNLEIPITNIQLEGPFDSSYSLAIVNKNLALALQRYYSTSLYSTEGHGDYIPDETFLDDATKSLYKKNTHYVDICIRNLYPPRTSFMKGYERVLGPYGWEESALPKEYIDAFNRRLTHVFCMSKYVQDVLVFNGLRIPSTVVGLGVDHLLQHPARKLEPVLPDNFKLLHISSCFPRKGVDVLLEAFEYLLEKGLDVSLVIKTFPNPHNKIKQQIQALKLKTQRNIILIDTQLSQDQINYLYENCDCLVAPSRGEGFGLPIAEAMLYNLPVIATAYGGHMDFCSEEIAWLVDFEYQKSSSHMQLFNSYWANPLKESLCEKILEIYKADQCTIEPKTKKAKKIIENKFSWNIVAENMYKSLQKSHEKNQITVRLGWVSSYNTKCGIANYSKHILSHMDKTLFQVKKYANHSQTPLNPVEEISLRRCWGDRFDNSIDQLITQITKDKITHIVLNFNFAFFSMKNLEILIRHCAYKKIKLIIIFHSVKDVEIPGLEASLSSIAKSLALAHLLLVHAIPELNHLKKIGLSNIQLLPHGVQFDSTVPLPKIQKVTTLGSYGFLLPHKGIAELIEAFAIIKQNFPHLRLVLINACYPAKISQEYLFQCKEIISKLKLNNDVELMSSYLSENDTAMKLRDIDIFILPYRQTNESSSAAVRQVLSTLKPTIVTSEPVFNDVTECVHFMKGSTPAQMAKSIRYFISNPQLLHGKTKIQKAWLIENKWENVTKKLENFILYI